MQFLHQVGACEAVKAEAADRSRIACRHRQRAGDDRQVSMKRRIEARDVARIGKRALTEFEQRDFARKVQRGERDQRPQGLHDVARDRGRRRQIGAAMDHAVHDGGGRLRKQIRLQPGEEPAGRIRKSRHGGVEIRAHRVSLHDGVERGLSCPDAADRAVRDAIERRMPEHGELEARRSPVDGEQRVRVERGGHQQRVAVCGDRRGDGGQTHTPCRAVRPLRRPPDDVVRRQSSEVCEISLNRAAIFLGTRVDVQVSGWLELAGVESHSRLLRREAQLWWFCARAFEWMACVEPKPRMRR